MKRRGPTLEPGIDGVRRVTLTLDDMTVKMLTGIGRGNVSAGVRLAAREVFWRLQAAALVPVNPDTTSSESDA